LDNKTNIVKD